MERAALSAASAVVAQSGRLDVITNNLANVNTAGFRRQASAFAQSLAAAGAATATLQGAAVDLTPGPLRRTEAPLDVALAGPGLLRLIAPDGQTFYGRGGQLHLDAAGRLTTAGGDWVSAGGAPLQLASEQVTIAPDGAVRDADGALAGTLDLVASDVPFTQVGAGRLQPMGAAPAPAGEQVRLLQGTVEESNVQAMRETTALIETQRGLEAALEALRTLNQLPLKANDIGSL